MKSPPQRYALWGVFIRIIAGQGERLAEEGDKGKTAYYPQ